MSKLVSTLFKIARMLDTAEMIGKGKGLKRAKSPFLPVLNRFEGFLGKKIEKDLKSEKKDKKIKK